MQRALDFTFISNPLGPSNKARHAMRKSCKTVPRFPDTEEESLTRYLCSVEKVSAAQMLLGHGSSHILSLLLHALKPKSMLVPSPCPRACEELLQTHGVEMRAFPLERAKGFILDVRGFEEVWKGAEAALVLSPHNPTGAMASEESLTRLVETSKRLNKPLIIDGGLAEFAGVQRYGRYVCGSTHALYLGTFSSYHALAGLRLGYAVGPEALLRQLRTIMGPRPPNAVALAAALASLKDKGYRKRTSAFLAGEQAYVLKKMEGRATIRATIELSETPWGFLIYMRPSLADLKQRFFDRGMLVEVYTDAQGHQYLSFPLRSHPQNARFLRALHGILREQKTNDQG